MNLESPKLNPKSVNPEHPNPKPGAVNLGELFGKLLEPRLASNETCVPVLGLFVG